MSNSEGVYLRQLINTAEREIDENREFYTNGNILALEYMVNEAKKALSGHGKVPFIRSRQWMNEADINPIRYATKRYTMVGTYDMHEYGLEPAITWFKSTHIMKRLSEASSLAKERGQKLLSYPTDGTIGSISKCLLSNVEFALENLNNKTGDELGKATVKLLNAIRDAKASRVISTSLDKQSTIFTSSAQKTDFINHVLNDNMLKSELDAIKVFSERYTLEQTKLTKLMMVPNVDYSKLNNEFYIWNSTEKVITFVTPQEAEYAKIRFILPSCENEENGIGHVWIDNINVFPSKGKDWDIKNNGFENGNGADAEYWTARSLSGNPTIRREDKYPFCGNEKYSMMLQNYTSEDCACLEYFEDIKIDGDVNNTLFFNGKLDGKCVHGLRFEIDFLDKDKNKIDEFVHVFNRKAMLNPGEFLLTCQADAIMYFFTGEIEYAKKSMYQIMYILNDFCQGIEHWLVYDKRPEGSDAFGAVQGGRVLSSVMSAYSLIKNSEVFSFSDLETMKEQLKYFFTYMLDLRDRSELSQHDMQEFSGNWQTDMASGVLFTTLSMPELELAPYWREISIDFLKSQLRENVGADGSWPESLRYHFAATSRFAIVAKVLKNCIGEDWFKDECISNMFKYPLYMQTPPYEYFDGKPSTIPFGDHHLDNGQCLAPLGIYCGEVAKVNKTLGTQMYKVWANAGRPVNKYWGEAVAFENLMAPGESFTDSEEAFELNSCNEFPDSGIYTFRKNFGVPGKESLFAIMAPYKKIGHGHYDEGSFIIYHKNVPVVVDPGIEGYFDSTKDWYVSSSAHSTLMFARSGGPKLKPDPFDINLEKTEYSAILGWNDTSRTAKVINFSTSDTVDEITVEINNPSGDGIHTRNVKFLRNEDKYIITDTTKDYNGDVLFTLPIAAKSVRIDGKTVYAVCYYGINAKVEFDGDIEQIDVSDGRTLKYFPCDGEPTTKFVKVKAKCGLTTTITMI